MREAVVIILDIVGLLAIIGVLAVGVAWVLTKVSAAHEDIG